MGTVRWLHTATSDDLGEADVTLQCGDVGGVGRSDRVGRLDAGQRRADELLDGGLLRLDLAEGGQDVADVAQEALVGADHEDALAAQLLAEGVEEVRRAVQPDGGLAGAGGTLDADRLRQVGADDDVLLGLDGGDDVAHRTDAGPLDLLLEDRGVVLGRAGVGGLPVGRAHAGRVGVLRGRRDPQPLVLEGGDLPGPEAEAAPRLDTEGVAGAGAVERQADRGPPVDDHRVARLVADVAAADVERAPGLGVVRCVVEASEEQRDGRVVLERRQPAPLGGFEQHPADPVGGGRGVHGGGTSRIRARCSRDEVRWARSAASSSVGIRRFSHRPATRFPREWACRAARVGVSCGASGRVVRR